MTLYIPKSLPELTGTPKAQMRAFLQDLEGCIGPIRQINIRPALLRPYPDVQFVFAGADAHESANALRKGLNRVKDVLELDTEYYAGVAGCNTVVDSKLLTALLWAHESNHAQWREAFSAGTGRALDAAAVKGPAAVMHTEFDPSRARLCRKSGAEGWGAAYGLDTRKSNFVDR
jgi:hypothetical protein